MIDRYVLSRKQEVRESCWSERKWLLPPSAASRLGPDRVALFISKAAAKQSISSADGYSLTGTFRELDLGFHIEVIACAVIH